MDERQKTIIINLFNRLKLEQVEEVNEGTVLFSFKEGLRLYIDSNDTGIEFSLTALSEDAAKIIENLEK